MSASEAGVVTLLGMSVVFLGLLLCVAFIEAFNRLARRLEPAPAGAPAPGAAAAPLVPEPVPDEVLAVIATVLELERKLYSSRPEAGPGPGRPAPEP